jgi:D-alanyl-D-alanine carboxypeptidase/D-alanyl-D-alanine-endopeptidase (penicillin-binding protein 4)
MLIEFSSTRWRRSPRVALCSAVFTFACAIAACPRVAGAQQHRPSASKGASSKSAKQQRPDIARFQARVAAALAGPNARKAYWGIFVTDAATGQTLYELNADGLFTPASNAKIFTSAFAFATLGSDYTFRTTIETSGQLDANGRLRGDLSLVGRGDPDLSNRKLPFVQKVERDGDADKIIAELADAVVARGVKRIDGDIIGDDSYFAYDPYPEGWTTGDLYFSFGAPISAIALNDNVITVDIRPGEHLDDPAQLTVEPAAGYETFGHEITTAPSASKVKFSVVREPGVKPVLLRGSIPLGSAPVKIDLALQEPAEYSAALLKKLLEARGVEISGTARALHGPPPERQADGGNVLTPSPIVVAPRPPANPPLVLAEHKSLPLIESIRLLNKISQNLHAELLLRTIAREKANIGTTDAGIELEKQFLRAAGIADGDVVLVDGSGLSRQNLVSPRAVVQMLAYAAQQPWCDSFRSTLPIAGEDGTLEDRLKGTAAAGRIHAKTGSLEHVRGISGYATTLHGENLVFSIFTNNNAAPPHEQSAVFDAILIAMIEELRLPAARK